MKLEKEVLTKEERIQRAYEVYEQQVKEVDKQANEARKWHRDNLYAVLKTIRESPS